MLAVWIAWGFAILYACLQAYYIYNWIKTPEYKPTLSNESATGVSIVIIARNESANIQACLKSILKQNLSGDQFEIIVVDDHSTDDTIDKVRELNNGQIQLFRLMDYPEYIHEPAFKKSGITLALDKSKFEKILVTDADCVHGEDWLKTTVRSFDSRDNVFQTGPVVIKNDESLLEKMQGVEQLSLMLITSAGISSGLHDIANGANMIFSKAAFKEIDGYAGNYQYASGDDMFLIEKMRIAFPNKISFLKSDKAIVYTRGKNTWDALIGQRLRWAKKNRGLKSQVIKNLWRFVGLYHLFLMLSFITAILALTPWNSFLILLLAKWLADYFVVNSSASFFKRADLVRLFVTLQMFYFWYVLRLSFAMLTGKKGDWR